MGKPVFVRALILVVMLALATASVTTAAGDGGGASVAKKRGCKKKAKGKASSAKSKKCKRKKKEKEPAKPPFNEGVAVTSVRATVSVSPAGTPFFVGAFYDPSGKGICTGRPAPACPLGNVDGFKIAPFSPTNPTTPVTVSETKISFLQSKELSYVVCGDLATNNEVATVIYTTADGASHTYTSPAGQLDNPKYGFAISPAGAYPVPVLPSGEPNACD